ncbi:MAG TPA: cell division ATP-binding protein FtsE [Thalassobaculum sp.]
MVRFENVFMRYDGGPVILRDVSFELEPGSFHFLTGGSGAGKSTLLRLMYLAARPVSGRVTLFNRDVSRIRRTERPAMRRRVGVVFQDFRLLPHLSVLDNVALPLRIAGTRESLLREHVPELLAWVGLSGHLDALPATLSGGQQQRIAIARAVIGRPSLLLADEPTGNVDDRIAIRLLYLFEELNKMGTTVLIATHNEALVQRFDHPRLHLEGARLTRVAMPAPAPGSTSGLAPVASGVAAARPA